MAKQLLSSYSFTPGAANAGTVVVPGSYTLEQFLLITNVTSGTIIYQFNVPSKGAVLTTGGGNTTLTLEFSTQSMSAADRLQVFIDDLTTGGGGSLSSIDGKVPALVGGRVPVDGSGVTQPVSGSVTVSGVATAANQATANTSLNNLDVDLGAQADAAATTDNGTFSLIALFKRQLGNWTTLLGRIPSLTVNSTRLLVDGSGVTQPVSGTFWQATQPVSGSVTANGGTNLNTSALALETGGNLASINTKIPAQGAAQPSASLPTVLPNKVLVTYAAATPALNLDVLTNTVNGWFDARNYNYANITIQVGSGVSAGTFVFEQTNDPTISGAVPLWQVNGASNASSPVILSTSIGVTASTNYTYSGPISSAYVRVRTLVAFAGGTVRVDSAFSNAPVTQASGLIQSSDLRSLIGIIATTASVNGNNNNTSLGVFPVSGFSNTDYSAQNVAAANGSLTVIALSSNAPSLTFDINLTAFTAGTSTGLDIYLQESPDNGTTFYDIWQCEAFTAAGRARIPALPVNGRRRIRWVNRTGAATTATLTVTSMGTPAALPIQRQFFDRTSGVGSGTAVVNTNSAAYDIAGCKAFAVVMQAGTATAVASFQAQMSMDGTNWYNASTATAIGATTANNTIIPITSGLTGRFIRVTCTAAGTSQTINAIHILGIN